MKLPRLSAVFEPVFVDESPLIPKANLTTLERDERCDGCDWPDVCAGDRTCWREEAHQAWVRPILDGIDELRERRPDWTREGVIAALQEFAVRTGRAPTRTDIGVWADARKHGLPHPSATKRLFGDMGAALEAAGFDGRKRGGFRRRAA